MFISGRAWTRSPPWQYWAVLIQRSKPCGRNKSWLWSYLEVTMLLTSKPSRAISCNWRCAVVYHENSHMMCSTLSRKESYIPGSEIALCFKSASPTAIPETSARECLVNSVDICYVICRCPLFQCIIKL